MNRLENSIRMLSSTSVPLREARKMNYSEYNEVRKEQGSDDNKTSKDLI